MGCSGCTKSRAALKGRTPTSTRRTSWIVILDGPLAPVSDHESELEARAYLASQGGKGHVVRKRS